MSERPGDAGIVEAFAQRRRQVLWQQAPPMACADFQRRAAPHADIGDEARDTFRRLQTFVRTQRS